MSPHLPSTVYRFPIHELSIAMSILELAEEEGERRGARVCADRLKLGRLSGLVKDALQSSYELACENTALAGARLVIEEIPVVVYCPRCQAQRALSSIRGFVCPECRTPTPEVVQGREVEVVALELEE